MGTTSTLANQLLIAMPSLADGHFSQTVALVCEHSDRGALGIVLNKPIGMKLGDVMAQMRLQPTNIDISEQLVLRGGPVHTDRGFVLHRPGGEWDSTHRVSDRVQVTTSRDVLAAIARGEGPQDAFVALGYAGWEAGQLEREMLDNAWLSLPVDERIVFDLPFEDRWQAALRVPASGIDWNQIEKTLNAFHPALLVVGSPRNADGSAGTLSAAADRFALALAQRSRLPVERTDEYASSLEAADTLRAQRASGQRRRRVQRGDIDSAAAAIILERWLNREQITVRSDGSGRDD